MLTHAYRSDIMSLRSTAPSNKQKIASASCHEKFAFSVDEACRLLSIGRSSLYELAKSGDLKLIKIAGRTLVPRSEMERLTHVGVADEGRLLA